MKTTIQPVLLLLGLLCFFLPSCKSKTLFHLLPASRSGIHFNNEIIENDSINPIDVTNIYNGGGVGIGDFNNDGLQDIYFAGNLVPNQLYLNRGGMKFREVTREAGVDGEGRWSRGIAVVDINNDGWQDIYVCASMLKEAQKRQNLLYLNQGAGSDGVPRFTEVAAAYGLNDTTHSTTAAFFDFDNDGDLDLYLTVNEIIEGDIPSIFRPKVTDGSHPSTGRLYRNDFDAARNHPVFTDVSHQAGTTIEGYGHGTTIADFNRDGWKDIFVTNDFNSDDLLYINNKNGTFTDKAGTYFKHTSANGMGQDVIDINNDGLSDVVELDMSPEDNYRKKMMLNGNSYQTYQNSDLYGYRYQYVRNTLQLNQGPRVLGNDSIGDPIFSDVGYFSGIAETDWSWTPLVTDFDNDGLRDLVVTNGFPKDITDHDFIAFRKESFSVAPKAYVLQQIPQVKLPNYAFRNTGDARFSNVTESWGLTQPSFSSGAAHADLDNDGDMDMVINNTNHKAFVYENLLNDGKKEEAHYLRVRLKGAAQNRDGIGSWVEIFYGGQTQAYEQTPYRGYLSTIQMDPHFGLGSITSVDSLVVKWPDGKKQVLRNVKANQQVTVRIEEATETYNWQQPAFATAALFRDITGALGLDLRHFQKDYIDFNVQKLLPHKFSEYGPSLAVGDVNGDALDDLVMGGNYAFPATLLLQRSGGGFDKKPLTETENIHYWMHAGLTLFDADGDADLDLYAARGGYQPDPNSADYADQLWVNDGTGSFRADTSGLPRIYASKSCVRPFDYDRDGDLDLFLAGRVAPWQYPKPADSYILRNDSRQGQARFTDVTSSVAPGLKEAGMICDAISTDFDGDGWPDLVMAGEWAPVKFLKNERGVFKDVTGATGLAGKLGWWNSVLPADFDNDGDMDYVVSNLGLNSFYRASEKEPVRIYAKDFDNNGSYDAIPTLYLPFSKEKPERREFVAHTRDDMAKQLISFKSKFQNYNSYAQASFSQMFKPEELKDAMVLEANEFRHCLLENTGGGKFNFIPLPMNTQYVCLNGMVAEDVDGDGNMDIIANGNDYGTEPTVGRYDACNGLVLKGNGKGGFAPLPIIKTGLFIPGNGKALVKLRNASGNTLIAAGQNRGPLKIFLLKEKARSLTVKAGATQVVLHFANGARQKHEVGYGTSFLSQSGRFLNIGPRVSFAEIYDARGAVERIDFDNGLALLGSKK